MDSSCNLDAEDSETKFRKTLRQIITLAPKVRCPHEQQVMQEWIDRLMQPPCTEEDEERRLEYSRYMLFQLKRGKLHMPFLESPCQGELKPLEEVLNPKNDQPCPEPPKEQGSAEQGGSSESQKTSSMSARVSLTNQRRQSQLSKSLSATSVPCKIDPLEMVRRKVLSVMHCFNKDNTTLENFVVAIAPHTLDKGKLLMDVITSEQISYKDMIENLYREKEQKISSELAREQASIPQRYELAKQKMLSRAMAGLNYIKTVAPGFQYDRWKENPDYLREMFKLKERKTGGNENNMSEWERKTLQMLHDVNYESERMEEANADKEKEIQELIAQQTALEQDFNCKKAQLAKKIQELESEKFGYTIANDERDRMIEHLLRTIQNEAAAQEQSDQGPC